MIQAGQTGGADPRDPHVDRVARYIRDHIAKGNRPDYELAQKKARELDRMAQTFAPLGLTEEEIDNLAVELCRRKDDAQ